MTACRSYLLEDPDILSLLPASGMDPDLPNWQHATPLHDLCGRDGRGRPRPRRVEWAIILLEAGAAISAKDEEYRSTPLAWAAPTREILNLFGTNDDNKFAEDPTNCFNPGQVDDVVFDQARSFHSHPIVTGITSFHVDAAAQQVRGHLRELVEHDRAGHHDTGRDQERERAPPAGQTARESVTPSALTRV